jgi:hypothetical protein
MSNYETTFPYEKERDEQGRKIWVFTSGLNDKVAVYGNPKRDKSGKALIYQVRYIKPSVGEHSILLNEKDMGRMPTNTIVSKDVVARKAFDSIPFLE